MGVSTISLASNFLGLFEEKLNLGNLTRDLNANQYTWVGGNAVKVAIPEVGSIGSYNRQAGYTASNFNLTWQTMTLSQDRYICIDIDEMSDDESKRTAVRGAISDSGVEATEEMDMYILGKIATTTNVVEVNTPATLTSGTDVYNAIAIGEAQQINGRGRLTDCILYINATNYMKLKSAMAYRFKTGEDINEIFETYDDMKVRIVPDDMLSMGTEYNSTTGKIEAKVYNSTKHQYVNFMIVNKKAIAKAVKLYDNKFIDWKANQTSRANRVILNWYYDVFVLDRYVKVIYVHRQAEA